MKRVLAMDPTTRGFGYAVLEGPDALVDWGLKGTSRRPASPNGWCLKEAVRLIGDGCTNYTVALALTGRFPELAWRLPPVRKPWMSEDARMAIFGAVALAVASYGQSVHRSGAC